MAFGAGIARGAQRTDAKTTNESEASLGTALLYPNCGFYTMPPREAVDSAVLNGNANAQSVVVYEGKNGNALAAKATIMRPFRLSDDVPQVEQQQEPQVDQYSQRNKRRERVDTVQQPSVSAPSSSSRLRERERERECDGRSSRVHIRPFRLPPQAQAQVPVPAVPAVSSVRPSSSFSASSTREREGILVPVSVSAPVSASSSSVSSSSALDYRAPWERPELLQAAGLTNLAGEGEASGSDSGNGNGNGRGGRATVTTASTATDIHHVEGGGGTRTNGANGSIGVCVDTHTDTCGQVEVSEIGFEPPQPQPGKANESVSTPLPWSAMHSSERASKEVPQAAGGAGGSATFAFAEPCKVNFNLGHSHNHGYNDSYNHEDNQYKSDMCNKADAKREWEELQEQYQCGICLGLLAAPCLSDCSHSFCGACALAYARTAESTRSDRRNNSNSQSQRGRGVLGDRVHQRRGDRAQRKVCCPMCRSDVRASFVYERVLDGEIARKVGLLPDSGDETVEEDKRSWGFRRSGYTSFIAVAQRGHNNNSSINGNMDVDAIYGPTGIGEFLFPYSPDDLYNNLYNQYIEEEEPELELELEPVQRGIDLFELAAEWVVPLTAALVGLVLLVAPDDRYANTGANTGSNRRRRR